MKKILSIISALIIMCSLSACSLFNPNLNNNSHNDSNVSEDSNEDNEYEDDSNEYQDSSTTESIDNACSLFQEALNDNGVDTIVSHGTDYEGNDTIEVYLNSEISQQEVQNMKNEFGYQNYIDTVESILNESTNFQNIIGYEQTLIDYGINAYIVLHATCSDNYSSDVAVFTTSTGWQVF